MKGLNQRIRADQTLSRLFNALTVREAGELHQRLQSGGNSPETRLLVRNGLRQAGLTTKAA